MTVSSWARTYGPVLVFRRLWEDLDRKRAKAFITPRGLRRFVELIGGEMVIKERAIKKEARYDGKWVLRTSTELPTAEVALAYKSLWQIEHPFRATGLRPPARVQTLPWPPMRGPTSHVVIRHYAQLWLSLGHCQT